MRIVIGGGPNTGKTTLAAQLANGSPSLSTDDLMHLPWSEASVVASFWYDAPGPWVVEGVAAARALRKWLKRHATGKPCDRVIWLRQPKAPQVGGQVAMAKGCETVWREIAGTLAGRGVEIVYQ
jgi:adenylate kinase family enzyme